MDQISDNQNNIKMYLLRNLDTTIIGKKIYYRARLNSTMEYAKLLAKKGANEGTVIIAGRQTAGKGRMGRTWLSPANNIAMSIILHPPLNGLAQIIMIASLAVVRALNNTCKVNSKIKWPNDILINGKKVCGILIENEVKAHQINFTVIGMGINVNLDFTTFTEIASLATSLSNELGHEVGRDEICGNVLSEIEKLYIRVLSGGSLYHEWKGNMVMLGKTIQVQTGQIINLGIAEDVTEQGNLILRKEDDSLAEIFAGDVSVL
jgi:BirA family biotin operon repressor/biotin-[acetyl-CoA-carboxylase] ligase